VSSLDGTVGVMGKLLRHMFPEMAEDTVQELALIAGETYLDLVDRVPPEERGELIDTILDEVIDTYLP
jgi:hypothetical protein